MRRFFLPVKIKSSLFSFKPDLLNFCFENPERILTKKLFFAQQEAVETAIWMNEVADKSNAKPCP